MTPLRYLVLPLAVAILWLGGVAVAGATPAPSAATLAPSEAFVRAGMPVALTVTQAGDAASLATLELRVVDRFGVTAHVRYDAVAGTIAIFDPMAEVFTAGAAPGSAGTLETAWAKLSLGETQIDRSTDGAGALTMTVVLTIKGDAASLNADIELMATDRAGGSTGFRQGGTLTTTGIRW